MKTVKTLTLTMSLWTAGTAVAAAGSVTGSPALALASVVAAPSPTLSPAEKKAVAAFFDSKNGPSMKGKITVSAVRIVCRISNVDVTSRSCELTFGKQKVSFTGREANELYATEAFAGVPSDGAAGSTFESLSRLKCTLDPAERQGRRWRRLFLRGSAIALLRQNLTVRRRGRPSESEAVANGRYQVARRYRAMLRRAGAPITQRFSVSTIPLRFPG